MGGRLLLIVSFLAVAGAISVYHDESELSQLPKLFYLDDYEKCLSEKDGIYCNGQFLLYSDVNDHPTYQLIEKYTKDGDLYNRSYIHHGYCLNTRCPSTESNLTARFETCVDNWTQTRYKLRARLIRLSFCKEHGKPYEKSPDTEDIPHQLFLYLVIALLALNMAGTIYDLYFDDGKVNHEYLRLWSIRRNWRQLYAAPAPNEERGLDSLHGLKATFLTWGPMFLHAVIFISAAYQRNPRFLEKFLQTPIGPMTGSLTMFTQLHMVISNFLTAYAILWTPNVSFKSLPTLIVKRLARMLPVYLLVIGFAATWWTSLGSGPMWHHMVEHESSVCRNKFWLTTAFLQNIVDPGNICLVQTWIMAVDMQVHIPVLIVVIFLRNHREWTHWVLSALYVVGLAVVTHYAFKNDYLPAYTYMVPDVFRTFFGNCRSFIYFYMAPTGCLMSAVVGVWCAFIHKDLKDRGVQLKGFLWEALTNLMTPLIFLMAAGAYLLKDDRVDPWIVTTMIPVERILYTIALSVTLLLLINVDSYFSWFLRWFPLRVISKMSLGIAMIHWVVNGTLVGNRYILQDSSVLGIVSDIITINVLSTVLAVPLTLMVDLPAQKTVDKLVKKFNSKSE